MQQAAAVGERAGLQGGGRATPTHTVNGRQLDFHQVSSYSTCKAHTCGSTCSIEQYILGSGGAVVYLRTYVCACRALCVLYCGIGECPVGCERPKLPFLVSHRYLHKKQGQITNR